MGQTGSLPATATPSATPTPSLLAAGAAPSSAFANSSLSIAPNLATMVVDTIGMAAVEVDAAGFTPPQNSGGSMLTTWPDPASLGEPLNLIVSGASDGAVLADAKLHGGIRNYFLSGNQDDEAFGLHLGDPQLADLGDGAGSTPQLRELRHNYRDPVFGTLHETLVGGNHLRYWRQQGSGAYFVQLGAEKSVKEHHDIVPDGYDAGRDQFVSLLVGQEVKKPIEPGFEVQGESRSMGWHYATSVKYVAGLMDVDQNKINHFETVAVDGKVTDGLVAVLTVRITKRGIL